MFIPVTKRNKDYLTYMVGGDNDYLYLVLSTEVVDWLNERNIKYHCNPHVETAMSTSRLLECVATGLVGITIENPKDAVLFKLRWL